MEIVIGVIIILFFWLADRYDLLRFLRKPKKKYVHYAYVRTSHCYACRTNLNNQVHFECSQCWWIICPNCGACKTRCVNGHPVKRTVQPKPVVSQNPPQVFKKPDYESQNPLGPAPLSVAKNEPALIKKSLVQQEEALDDEDKQIENFDTEEYVRKAAYNGEYRKSADFVEYAFYKIHHEVKLNGYELHILKKLRSYISTKAPGYNVYIKLITEEVLHTENEAQIFEVLELIFAELKNVSPAWWKTTNNIYFYENQCGEQPFEDRPRSASDLQDF